MIKTMAQQQKTTTTTTLNNVKKKQTQKKSTTNVKMITSKHMQKNKTRIYKYTTRFFFFSYVSDMGLYRGVYSSTGSSFG